MVFMRCGLTSRGQELGSVFSAAACKLQASTGNCYIQSLPLVLKGCLPIFSNPILSNEIDMSSKIFMSFIVYDCESWSITALIDFLIMTVL